MAHVLGIDIGGTGIKAAPVDTATGQLTADRLKLATPQPATPDAVEDVVRDLVKNFSWTGPAGITFPGVVTNGVIQTAANVDQSWIDSPTPVKPFGASSDLPVTVINDADAAGVAEMRFGAGAGERRHGAAADPRHRDRQRAVHRRHARAEHRVRPHRDPRQGRGEAGVRARPGGARAELGRLGRPGRRVPGTDGSAPGPRSLIIGGGVSKKADKFLPLLAGLRAKVVPAELQNDAGIVGAALVSAGS